MIAFAGRAGDTLCVASNSRCCGDRRWCSNHKDHEGRRLREPPTEASVVARRIAPPPLNATRPMFQP